MRKIKIFLLIGFCLLLTGCQKEDVKEKTKEITIGFAQAGTESNWRKVQSQSIKEELEKQEYQVMSRNSFSDPKQQYQDVMTFIAYQVDLIILSPIQEIGWEPILEEAKKPISW